MNSVKKLLIALVMMCGSPALFACDFYVGGALGVSQCNSTYKIDTNGPLMDFYQRTSIGGLGFIGGGQIGVEQYYDLCWFNREFEDLYVALEVNALYNSYSQLGLLNNAAGDRDLEQALDLKNDFLFGVDLKWGRRFCNATPYIVTGYTLSTWGFQFWNDTAINVVGLPGNSHKFKSVTKSGFKLGTGVRYDVSSCVFFDLQYSYSWFAPYSRDFVDIVQGPYKHKINLNQQRLLLGFNWTFGNY